MTISTKVRTAVKLSNAYFEIKFTKLTYSNANLNLMVIIQIIKFRSAP